MPSAVVLFSGGLDSMLALRILQLQGFEVEALNIRTIYTCCQLTSAQTAAAMGVPLTVLPVGEDYIEVIRNPLYGYGKGANPCVDCRIYMARMAKHFMEEVGACLVATGEILGQRPMSQQRQHLGIIESRSGLQGRLLRPLSAKLLPPTVPEEEGLVDRDALYQFHGRGRRDLIALGRSLDIPSLPTPSTGCALTEPTFARRVRDLLRHHPDATRWDFELLNTGRHVRWNKSTKLVVGRNFDENALLATYAKNGEPDRCCLLTPANFRGPNSLIVGDADEAAVAFAGGLMLRWSAEKGQEEAKARRSDGVGDAVVLVCRQSASEEAETL